MGHCLERAKIIDGHDLDVSTPGSNGPKEVTANTAKSVDTYAYSHNVVLSPRNVGLARGEPPQHLSSPPPHHGCPLRGQALEADIAMGHPQFVAHFGYSLCDVASQGNRPVSASRATDSDGEIASPLLHIGRQNQLEEAVYSL